MILQNGYQVATYYVTTQDGYLLEIFRIPSKPGDNRRNNQPILFEHGIFVDSGAWIFAGNKTLGKITYFIQYLFTSTFYKSFLL